VHGQRMCMCTAVAVVLTSMYVWHEHTGVPCDGFLLLSARVRGEPVRVEAAANLAVQAKA
jgi:hypothetical protein